MNNWMINVLHRKMLLIVLIIDNENIIQPFQNMKIHKRPFVKT